MRAMQVVQSTETSERALFFNMQTDFEAAVQVGRWMAAGTIGKNTSRAAESDVISRRHYLGFRLNDSFHTRVGRFYPEYGLNTANHRRVTRRFYDFDQGQETYNAEVSWASESFGAFVTGIFGRPFEDSSEAEAVDQSGVAVSAHTTLFETSRLGASLRTVSGDAKAATAFTIFGVAGFSKRLYLVAEGTLGASEDSSSSKNSMANYSRLAWEVYRGVHVYGVQEFYRPDTDDGNSDIVGFGGGLQLFPRPHFEFIGEYQLRRNSQTVSFSENLFTLLLHFYL